MSSALSALCMALGVNAQVDVQLLTASTGSSQATVGGGSATWGKWMVSGPQRPFDPIHVYELSEDDPPVWELRQDALFLPPAGVSLPSGAQAGRERQVAASNDRFVIGQELGGSQNKNEVVQVYVYDSGTDMWSLEQLLEPAAPADPAFFGGTVDIAGEWLAVGAQGEGVWLYEFNDPFWTQEQVLTPPAGSVNYAGDIAMDGNVLAVIDSGSTDAVRIYERSGGVWTLVRTVTTAAALGGRGLALDGDHLVYGDFFAGEITVLERTGASWANAPVATELSPYDYDVGLPNLSGYPASNFGLSVGISGDLLVAGAYNNTGTHYGAAYLWERIDGAWVQVQKMYGPQGTGGSTNYAGDIEIYDTWITTGGSEVVMGTPESRLWVLDVSSRPQWIDEGSALAGAAGAPVLVGHGNLHGPRLLLAQPDVFRLDLTGAAPSAAAYLFAGGSAINLSFKGGVLVPSVDVLLDNLMTNATGSLSLGAEWPSDAPSGLELYYHIWVEDAGGPVGFAASNAVRSVAP